jgi:hypothetical protein
MRPEIVYSPVDDIKEAQKELENKLKELKLSRFEPNFMLLFFTDGTYKNYRKFAELFRKYYPDVQMMGCFIEGYAVEDEIWTRGIVALLAEFDGEVKVFVERGNDLKEVCRRLGKKARDEWDAMLIMFPVFYFSSIFSFGRLMYNDRIYSRRYRNAKTIEEKKEVLKRYSNYLEKNFIFPIDRVLRYLSESTGGKFPIIGMNLMPMEAKVGTPVILVNYEEVGRGIAAICFKGKVNAVYHDIYPERGNSYEETVNIIKSYFSDAEEVEVVKAGIAIGEINGKPPVEFLREKREAFGEIVEEEFLKKLEEGRLETFSPYLLSFINKYNNSSTLLAIVNSPIKIYPSLMNVDRFHESCFFVGETFRGGPRKFGEVITKKKLDGFDLILLDADLIPAYRDDVYKTLEEIKKCSRNYISVFTNPPSAFIPLYDENNFTKYDENIFLTASGSNALLELK